MPNAHSSYNMPQDAPVVVYQPSSEVPGGKPIVDGVNSTVRIDGAGIHIDVSVPSGGVQRDAFELFDSGNQTIVKDSLITLYRNAPINLTLIHPAGPSSSVVEVKIKNYADGVATVNDSEGKVIDELATWPIAANGGMATLVYNPLRTKWVVAG